MIFNGNKRKAIGNSKVEAFCPGIPLDEAEFAFRFGVSTHVKHRAGGIPMPNLSDAILSPYATLTPQEISYPPFHYPHDSVTIAIHTKTEVQSQTENRGALIIPLQTARAIVDACLGKNPSSPSGLTTGEQGVLLYALDRAAGDWLAAQGTPFVIRGFLVDPGQIDDYLGGPVRATVAMQLKTPHILGQIHCAIRYASPKLDVPSGTSIHSLALAPANWPITFRLIVGNARIAQSAMCALAPHDCIVLDNLCVPDAKTDCAPAYLENGQCKIFVQWKSATELTIVDAIQRSRPMGETPTKNISANFTNSQPDDRAPDEHSSIQVNVLVEIGQIATSIGAATNMIKGEIITLDKPANSHVILKVGENPIAKGDLVQVEGQLAVEITEVL